MEQKRKKEEKLKKLDYNKIEYEYFLEYCGFTDRQKEIFALKRRGFSEIQISMYENKDFLYLPTSISTVKREMKNIRIKILENIK